MGDNILLIAAVVTIIWGISVSVKNRELIKDTLTDWTRRGRKVIYVHISQGNQGDFTVYLLLCGEETSLFYPSTYENHESYVLAVKQIYYDTSYGSNGNRYHARWQAIDVEPLSEYPPTWVFQLTGECGFRCRLTKDNDEKITYFDAFKFKDELKECLKKCEIQYDRKASNPQDRWKAKDK